MAGTAGIQNTLTIEARITGAANAVPDNFTLTRPGSIIDASVIPTAVDAGGTLLVGKGAAAISNAMACAALNTVARAASIDATTGAPPPNEFSVGDSLRITANQAGTRGRVYCTFLAPVANLGTSP